MWVIADGEEQVITQRPDGHACCLESERSKSADLHHLSLLQSVSATM